MGLGLELATHRYARRRRRAAIDHRSDHALGTHLGGVGCGGGKQVTEVTTPLALTSKPKPLLPPLSPTALASAAVGLMRLAWWG